MSETPSRWDVSHRVRAMCHDCGVLEGELHQYGCDMESCPGCGGQLITCDCAYVLLDLYDTEKYGEDTCFLPPDTYEHGLDKAQEAKWRQMLESKGRIPWILYPNFCARCGEPWPDIFMVPNKEWNKYVEPAMRGKMLCQSCYSWIKGLIDRFAA